LGLHEFLNDGFVRKIILLQAALFVFGFLVVPHSAYLIGDSAHYLKQIADFSSLSAPQGNKFPLFPLLAAIPNALLHDAVASALLVNFLAVSLAMVFFYRWTNSKKLALVFMFFPQFVLFSHGVYSEPVFVLLEVLALAAYSNERLAKSFFWQGVSILARGTGAFLSAGLALSMFLKRWKLSDAKFLAFPAACAAVLFLYYQFFFGNGFLHLGIFFRGGGMHFAVPAMSVKELLVSGAAVFLFLATTLFAWLRFREKRPELFWVSLAFSAFYIVSGFFGPIQLLPGQIDRFYLTVLPITLVVFSREIEKHFRFVLPACVLGALVLVYGWWF